MERTNENSRTRAKDADRIKAKATGRIKAKDADRGTARAAGKGAVGGDGSSHGLGGGRDLVAEIELLAQRLAVGTFELLVLIGEAEESGVWMLSGALSCGAWLAELSEIEISTARTQLRVARLMREFPRLCELMRTGEISYSKARVLAGCLDAGNHMELLALALVTPLRSLGMAIAAWSARNEDHDAIGDRQHESRSVSWRTDPDGMVTITARLEPVVAGMLCALVDKTVMVNDAPVGASLAQQRADALAAVTIGETWGTSTVPDAPMGAPASDATNAVADSHPATATAGPGASGRGASGRGAFGPGGASTADAGGLGSARPGGGGPMVAEVVIHVRGDGNTLADGTPLTDHAVGALLPESFVSLLICDSERRPIDASPRRRFPTRRQRRVIDERYRQCVSPGCVSEQFLQYDHRIPYAQGGLTVLENLQRLCGPHNRTKSEADGTGRPDR